MAEIRLIWTGKIGEESYRLTYNRYFEEVTIQRHQEHGWDPLLDGEDSQIQILALKQALAWHEKRLLKYPEWPPIEEEL